MSIDLRIPEARSLKAKRAVVKHLVEVARARYSVAAAETGHLDRWQRSELGFAALAGDQRHVEEVLDAVERFIWSEPAIEVVAVERYWTETA